MEEITSGHGEAYVTMLRALARRGAFARRTAKGAEIVAARGGSEESKGVLAPSDLRQMLDRGWLKSESADRIVISKRGIAALRKVLSGGAAAGAKTAATPMPRPRQSDGVPGLNSSESPLAWLRQRRDKRGNPLISQAEFEAGERLRADFWRAHMNPRVTASWSHAAQVYRRQRVRGPCAFEEADRVVIAREQVNRALKAVGPDLAGLLLDVCCFLKGLEQIEREADLSARSGKELLKVALRTLARHYGLIKPEETGPARIRHWGASGYRPEIE